MMMKMARVTVTLLLAGLIAFGGLRVLEAASADVRLKTLAADSKNAGNGSGVNGIRNMSGHETTDLSTKLLIIREQREAQRHVGESKPLSDLSAGGAGTDPCTVADTLPAPGGETRGLAWDGSSLWVLEGPDAGSYANAIVSLDAQGNVISSFQTPGDGPNGLAWDGTHLWCLDYLDEKIYKLDKTGSVLGSIPAPPGIASGLAWDGQHFRVAEWDSFKVYRISASDGSIISSFDAPGKDEEKYPYGLAWDGKDLWLSNSDGLNQLDPDNGTVLAQCTAENFRYGQAYALTWDGAHLWSGSWFSNPLQKIAIPAPANTITLTSPNGGEEWKIGSQQTIRWTYTGTPGAYVKVQLLRGGTAVQTIKSQAPIGAGGSGSASWTVPTVPIGSNYRIKLTSTGNAAVTDRSDADFSIKPKAGLTVAVTAKPARGAVPLQVQLSAAVTGGKAPYSYSWDVTGDGVEDDNRQSFSTYFTKPGIYAVKVTVTDANGAAVSKSATVTALVQPVVVARANPAGGGAGVQVHLNATAYDPDGNITRFEWDFEGNGSYDYSHAGSPAVVHAYSNNGSYNATVRVTDNDGLKATDSVTITVGALPMVSAGAEPVAGVAPLTVRFHGAASDPDGTVVSYQWDFDGDGNFDWQSTVDGNTTHVYSEPGAFGATLRVTDNDGLSAFSYNLVTVQGNPVARPGAYPVTGPPPLTVNFFANAQCNTGTPLYYDWDYDGDGTYDKHFTSTLNSSFTYAKPGVYSAALKVTDSLGNAGTGVVQITVTDPGNGGPAVSAAAAPDNGGAPLAVTLMGRASDVAANLVKYQWDFEGDGVYDWQEAVRASGQMGSTIAVQNPWGHVFGDLDGDGDLDLLVGCGDGTVYFYRNDGGKSAPLWNYVGLLRDAENSTIDTGLDSSPFLADLDGDGDLDLIIGAYYPGTVAWYRNTGTKKEPVWQSEGLLNDSGGNPVNVGYESVPVLVDLDGDDDLDLIVGEYYGTFIHYRNTGTRSVPKFELAGPLKDAGGAVIDTGTGSAPFIGDLDGDGNLDLLSGDSDGTVIHYRNTGTGQSPQWTLMGRLLDETGTAIDAGGWSTPALADMDNDGDPDLFLGSWYTHRLVYCRNAGSSSSPVWRVITPSYGVIATASGNSHPALADIDNDGGMDVLVGDSQGRLFLYTGVAAGQSPGWNPAGFLIDGTGATITVNVDAAPVFGDLDGDGDWDLIVGNGSGYLYLYRNDGTKEAPQWVSTGAIQDSGGNAIKVSTGATPALFDVDGDGDLDFFIGEYYGKVVFYRNDGSPSAPVWTSVGPIQNDTGAVLSVGYRSSPVFVDINGDGLQDLLIGEYYGKLFYYFNTGGQGAPVWHLSSSSYEGYQVGYYGTPAAADVDGDGDIDLIVGNESGFLHYYPNQGAVRHVYDSPGVYHPVFSATDSQGRSAAASVEVQVLGAGGPSVFAGASLRTGVIPLKVDLFGHAAAYGASIVKFEWDFDGDGSFDWTHASSATTTHTYSKAGPVTVTLRATDSSGKKATDSLTVEPLPVVTTTRTGLFSPTNGEKTSICAALNDDAKVTVKILNSANQVVKVLVKNEARTKDTQYCNDWNGLNGDGKLVLDGIYYFVIEYETGGVKHVFDQRDTANYGLREDITRSWGANFDPYSDQPLEVKFSLSKPSEVNLYFWKRDPATNALIQIRTLLVREPCGAGAQTIAWDGVDNRGAVVPPDEYPVVIWSYPLPDNAVIVTGARPVISGVKADPNYVSTGYNPYRLEGNRGARVSFTLSKSVDVNVEIVNPLGSVIRTMSLPGLPAGANGFFWDGRDQTGKPVAPGGYSLGLSAVDKLGNRARERYAAVMVMD